MFKLSGSLRTLMGAVCLASVGSLAFTSAAFAQQPGAEQPQVGATQGHEQHKNLPNVVVLATGGTIAGKASSDMNTTGYTSGVLTGKELIESVPGLNTVANVTAEQISNVDSKDMTNTILLKLAKRVNALLAEPDIAGVVVTHGTDTLEETAYFLNLVVKSNKPVVVTGAMRPATALSADGPSNLLQSVIVAASPEARDRGVMVVMNDRIIAARFATKTDANNMDTFTGRTHGFLGTLVDNVPYFENAVLKLHTTQTPFDVSKLKTLPDVTIVANYQSDDGFEYDAAVKHGVEGIVASAVGDGTLSVPDIKHIREAMEKGVIVVRSTRTLSGFVPVDARYPGLSANDINPQKARILLMLALTVTKDPQRIQQMFNTY